MNARTRTKTKQRKRFSIALDHDTYRMLVKSADADHRTLTAQVAVAIETFLRRRELSHNS